ncbi:hypothetical protein D3C81_199920 [compost metagenome]
MVFDPEVLLPEGMAKELFRGNELYYNALAFLASTIRDRDSGLSIYRGEDIQDTVEEWFSSYMDDHTAHHLQDHQAEMMKKATHMHNLLPDGIFERFDIHEIRPRGVFFSGIIHDIDYR